MKLSFFIILAIFTFKLYATEIVPSINLWKNQGDFFWSLDFENEKSFKSKLSTYYESVYRGELLNEIRKWIIEGNLESEYFSSYYSDLRDIKIVSIKKQDANSYTILAQQDSCYSIEYNPPDLKTIVNDYKVINLSQLDVNERLKHINIQRIDEICLEVNRVIVLTLNTANLITGEKWEIINSTLELKPNKGINRIPKIGTFFGNMTPKKAPIVSTSYAGRYV